MVRVIGGLAAAAVAALPVAVHPDGRVAAVSVLAGLVCTAGLLLASLGVTTVGTVLALLVFAAASVATPAGSAVPEAIAMGAALLTVLDLAYFRRCVRGTWIGPGVLPVHLADLALSVAVAAAAAAALLGLVALLPAAPAGMARPLLAGVGGLLVYAACIRAIARHG
jgi:hypothetical protein